MQSVLLLNPPGKEKYFRDNYCSPVSRASYYHQPIDLLVQSGFLKAEFDVDILDCIVEGKDDEDVLNQLQKKEYIAILSLTGTASWVEDFNLLEKVSIQFPDITIALSGNLALFEYPRLFKELSFLDVALLEYTTDDFKRYLQGKYDELERIAYKKDGELVVENLKRIKKSFSYPIPTHEKFKTNLYHLPLSINHPSTIILSSAGCPYVCEFCVASEIKYRYREVSNLIEEMVHIQSLGIKEIFFQDFMIDARKSRTIEICIAMKEAGLKLSWYCSCRVDTVDEELLKHMKAAGCHTVLFGIESADEKALDSQQKGTNMAQIKTAINLCNNIGIRPFGNFIIGLPGESEESLLELGNFARKIGCVNAVFSTLVPDVGTELRKKSIANTKITDELITFSNSDKLYPDKIGEISPERLVEIREKVMKDFYLHPSTIFKNLIRLKSFYELKRKFTQGLSLIRKI